MALSVDSSLCGFQNWQSYPRLKEILPPEYNYHVCKFTELSDAGFHAILRMAITTEEDVGLWRKNLEETTKVTFRVTRTFPHVGLKNVFREIYHCQHSGRRNNEKGKKNTECKATMDVTVKRCVKRCRSKNKDEHLPSFPTIVDLKWEHNHNLNTAAVLQFRDVSDHTKDTFLELFEKGHTPSSALEMHKGTIHLSSGEDYVYMAADRSVIPDVQSVYRLYQKQFTDLYGAQDGQNIEHRIAEMAEGLKTKDCNVAWKRTAHEQLALAVITPIMKRIMSHVHQSSEMMFVDSTGNCDRHGVRLFLLLTHCSAGGVPVGCLLTTSESYATINEALELYMSILPDGAFGNHGHPKLIMTDDCEALRKALKTVFPQSTLLLCTFHVLQAVWRWLWDSKHAVQKQHRPHYFFKVKAMLTAKSEEDIETCMEGLIEVCAAHPRFVEYVQNLYGRREEWALCFRKDLIVRGNNTNNYVEAAMKIFKDKVLHRTKAYNILQLIDFVTSYLEEFYCRLLIDVANGRCTNRKKGLVRDVTGSIPKEDISFEDDVYLVKSATQAGVVYAVDMNLGICTCVKGWNGGGCKHQAAIVLHCGMGSLNFLPVSPQEQNHFHFLATGKRVNTSWFAPLKSSTVTGEEQEMSLENDNSFAMHDDISMDPAVSPVATNEPVSSADESLNDKFQKIDDFATSVKELLQTDRQYFEPAVDMFLSSLQKINTHSHLFSALCSFGKYSGCSSKGKLIASSKRIGVQPTAIARRKHKLRGRNIVRAGRPTKTFLSSQMNKPAGCKEILRAVIPKRKAPHDNIYLCF